MWGVKALLFVYGRKACRVLQSKSVLNEIKACEYSEVKGELHLGVISLILFKLMQISHFYIFRKFNDVSFKLKIAKSLRRWIEKLVESLNCIAELNN